MVSLSWPKEIYFLPSRQLRAPGTRQMLQLRPLCSTRGNAICRAAQASLISPFVTALRIVSLPPLALGSGPKRASRLLPCPDASASGRREGSCRTGLCGGVVLAEPLLPWALPLGPGVPDPAEGTEGHHRSAARGCLHHSQFGPSGARGREGASASPRPRCALGGCGRPRARSPASGERDPGQQKGFFTSALPLSPPRGFGSEPPATRGGDQSTHG